MNDCVFIYEPEEIIRYLIEDGMIFCTLNNKGYFLKLDDTTKTIQMSLLPGTFRQVVTSLQSNNAPEATIVKTLLWNDEDEFWDHICDFVEIGLCGVIINQEEKFDKYNFEEIKENFIIARKYD